jgi:hypothetical protein
VRTLVLLRVLRVGNPVVRAVLRSRWHRLLSGSLALLEYRGHETGRPYAIPVVYVADGTDVLVLAARAEQKLWWRSFREGASARLTVRGEQRPVTGRVVADADELREGLRRYALARPRAGRALGARPKRTDAELDAIAATIKLVRFARSDGTKR